MNSSRPITTMPRSDIRLQPWRLPGKARIELETLAADFAPISLKQMDSVALLNRIDTKFLLTRSQLLEALAALQQEYQILTIEGRQLNQYRTLYFDTPDFALYRDHVNQRAERYKVRSREYVDSSLAFLEVKHRTRKDRTIKDRVLTAEQVVELSPGLGGWLSEVSPLDARDLEPKLWNTFTRITLANQQCCERVTLDVDLSFAFGGRGIHLDGLAIAEVKVDAGLRASTFLAQMRAQRIHAVGFSKYAIGVSMLYGQVKKNSLKPKLLLIKRMMKGTVCCD